MELYDVMRITFAAREYIRRCVFILRPCMDTNMGFSNRNHSCNSLRRKLVESMSNDGGPSRLSSENQRLLDEWQIIKIFYVARL